VRTQPYERFNWSWIPSGGSQRAIRHELVAHKTVLSGISEDGNHINLQGREENFPNDGCWVTIDVFLKTLYRYPLLESPAVPEYLRGFL
jgi:hypothetical protein